jgi:biotin synthase
MSALEREMGDLRVTAEPRLDWTRDQVAALFELPLNDLLYTAQWVHRRHFDANAVQVSTLLSIKTGACPEDCAYCPQSIRFATGVENHDLLPLAEVRAAARRAKEAGATRFCMGASYRGPKDSQLEPILAMVAEVKALGLETCATLGLLRAGQAEKLAAAGLDYYNHNLDSSAEFYGKIIGTRTYGDRLATLERVRAAGIKVCCGGILGMGETLEQRAEFAANLAELDPHEVPLNFLNPRPGTPFGDLDVLPASEALKAVAAFRLALPRTMLRFAGGREITLGDLGAKQGILGGINAVIVGNYLTTLGRPAESDLELLDDLQMPIKALNATI